MEPKIGWIIFSLLVTLFFNLLIIGIVQQDITLANSETQQTFSSATITSYTSITDIADVVSLIWTGFTYDYPSVFTGAWVLVKYVLLAIEIPIGWGLAVMIIRIGSPVFMGLASLIKS